jgi:hypothetical protein
MMGKIWEYLLVEKGERPEIRDSVCPTGELMTRSVYGACEGPKVKGKRILVRDHLSLMMFLDTFIHEHTHAADWYKDEEWVDEFATDMARNLLKHFEIKRREPK